MSQRVGTAGTVRSSTPPRPLSNVNPRSSSNTNLHGGSNASNAGGEPMKRWLLMAMAGTIAILLCRPILGFSVQSVITMVSSLLTQMLIVYGAFGDRHNVVHFGLIFLAPLSFFWFDFNQWKLVPVEALWLVVMFGVAQMTHFAYHHFWPQLGHCDGPELFNQTVLCMWTVRVVALVPEEVWFNGNLGKIHFCQSIIVASWAVLAAIYCAGSAQEGDFIDFSRRPIRNPGNYYFALGFVTAQLLSLWAALQNWHWLAGACAVWYAVRSVFPVHFTKGVGVANQQLKE